jgi:hypothetical protein
MTDDIKSNSNHAEGKSQLDIERDDGTNDPSELYRKLAELKKPWFLTPHLLKLNIFLLSGILSQATSGFDGSLLNGMQSLPYWQRFFNHPKGAHLSAVAMGR